MNKTFLDGKTLPEKMLELEQMVADFLKNVDPTAIAGITTQIQAIQTELATKAKEADFALAKADIATLTANLDALLKTVTALSGTKNRGHFATPAELAALANPQVDEFAWVGQAGAWDAYVYEASGWTKTGGTSTHTTGYDPAEIVAIKTAATTLTARVTAVEKAATDAAAAAAAAKSAADAAAVAAAKNTAAIAALPAAGSALPGQIELTVADTPAKMFAEIKSKGIAVPVTVADSSSDYPLQLFQDQLAQSPEGAQVMRIAKIHITGLIPKPDQAHYEMIEAYTDATLMVAVLESVDYSTSIFQCETEGSTNFIGAGTDAMFASYGGYKPLTHSSKNQGGYMTGGSVTKKLHYYFATGKVDRSGAGQDQHYTTLGEMLVMAEEDYDLQASV